MSGETRNECSSIRSVSSRGRSFRRRCSSAVGLSGTQQIVPITSHSATPKVSSSATVSVSTAAAKRLQTSGASLAIA